MHTLKHLRTPFRFGLLKCASEVNTYQQSPFGPLHPCCSRWFLQIRALWWNTDESSNTNTSDGTVIICSFCSQTFTQQLPVNVKGCPSNGPAVGKKSPSEVTSDQCHIIRQCSRLTFPEAKHSLFSLFPEVCPHLCSEPQHDWTQRGEDGNEAVAGDVVGWADSVYLRIHWLHLIGWALCMWV